jgi:hypothetical protein
MKNKLLILFLAIVNIGYAQSGLDLSGFYSSFNNYQYQNCVEYMGAFTEQSEGKDRLIWFLNNGVTHSYAGNYEQSNAYFTQAQNYFNEIKINMGNEALAYMLNPTKREYRGEDVELLMTYYFKAYNYLHLNNYQSALQELDNMESTLNGLLTEAMEKDNGLNKIALIYLMRGLIYDADADYENAYTNYHQAYEVYKYIYAGQLQMPEQLKKDLVRTAKLTNASNDLAQFESEFGLTYEAVKDPGNVIVFWQNGLGPEKEASVLNFSLNTQGGGMRFTNQVTGESFPAAATAVAGAATLLSRGGSVRMAYPNYIQRAEIFTDGQLMYGNTSVKLEAIEDVNALAIKSLQTRKNKEMSEMLTRFAVKQLGKAGAKKLLGKGLDQLGLGSLKGLADKGLDAAANATEKADTRHWGTLPNTIYYTRLSLPDGEQALILKTTGQGSMPKEVNQIVDCIPDKTSFVWFNTHESRLASAIPTQQVASTNPYALNTVTPVSNTYSNNASTYGALSMGNTSEGLNNYSISEVSLDLSQPLPILTPREYMNHLRTEKSYYTQVLDGYPKELKHGFQMNGKEYLTADYYIAENQIGSIDDRVYLEVRFNTNTRKKIIAIQDLSVHVREIIWADLKSSLYPNLTTDPNEADYKLVVEVNDLVARNNHFIIFVYGFIPVYLGLPSGFPKFTIQYNASLYTADNQQIGNTNARDSKQKVMLGLYNFSKQIGRARFKNNPLKTNPMEDVMRNTMGKTKTDLYRIHMNQGQSTLK